MDQANLGICSLLIISSVSLWPSSQPENDPFRVNGSWLDIFLDI